MKHLWLRVLVVLCAWAVWGAEPPLPRTTPKTKALPDNGQRYLFIVSTSVSMGRLEHDGRQALFDMIYTGLDGYMQTGDTYGVWTFNDQVNAGTFPMQLWNTNRLLDLASQATLFVKEQPYSGKKPALDRVVTAAQAVLRLVKDLNIIIISDDKARLQGTPFDELVNGLYEELSPDLEKTRRPLVTTLVARDGLLANATVTLAGERIFLPPRPVPEPPAPQATNAVQAASSVSGKPGSKSSKSPTAQRDQEVSSKSGLPHDPPRRTIIITAKQKDPRPDPETLAEPKPQVPTSVMTSLDSPTQPELFVLGLTDSSQARTQPSLSSPLADASVQDPPDPLATPTPPASERAGTTVENAKSDLPISGLQHQPSPDQGPQSVQPGSLAGLPRLGSAVGHLDLGPRTVAAREPSLALDRPAETNTGSAGLAGLATPPVGSKLSPVLWLTAGICFLVLAVMLAAAFRKLRRNAYQPSLITKSMERREFQ